MADTADTNTMRELEAALGTLAITSLEQRGLMVRPDMTAPAPGGVPARQVLIDRVSGALLGSGLGVLSGHRPRTLSVCMSAEAWLEHGLGTPPVLSDRIVGHAGELRTHGEAIAATIDRRRAGMPWFEAGVASFGNAALTRAVGLGLITSADAAMVPVLAGLDAVVTHATPRAAQASAAIAAITAALVRRPVGTTPIEVLHDAIVRVGDTALRASIVASLARLGTQPVGEVLAAAGPGLEAVPALIAALTCVAAFPDDPVAAISTASSRGDGTLLAAVGALVGAAHGATQLPIAWTRQWSDAPALRALAVRLTEGAPGGPGRRNPEDEAADLGDLGSTGVPRVWFLLDRSGSMSSIARAVVDGYNAFFADQRTTAGKAKATVVQFDSHDPHEVLLDDVAIDTVTPIDRRSFQPRGSTPLYDALGRLLDRAIACGGHPADQMVVVFTDGLENASRTWSREATFDRVSRMREDGWTFVFLGANQDSYATGADLAFADGSISNFLATDPGVDAAWVGTSRVVQEFRSKPRQERLRDRDNPWRDVKEAEDVTS